MLLDPAKHRFARVSCRDLGEPGCGVYMVRPRLGLIGMLAGWWQVKLSSGCPLCRPRLDIARARVADGETRERLWSRQKELYPGFADYEAKTTREIPVVILAPAA